jgi:hypothetical protein
MPSVYAGGPLASKSKGPAGGSPERRADGDPPGWTGLGGSKVLLIYISHYEIKAKCGGMTIRLVAGHDLER